MNKEFCQLIFKFKKMLYKGIINDYVLKIATLDIIFRVNNTSKSG